VWLARSSAEKNTDGGGMLAVGFRDQLGDLAGALDVACLDVAAREAGEGFDIVRLLRQRGSVDFGGGGEVVASEASSAAARSSATLGLRRAAVIPSAC
jgi:hypothetical protein